MGRVSNHDNADDIRDVLVMAVIDANVLGDHGERPALFIGDVSDAGGENKLVANAGGVMEGKLLFAVKNTADVHSQQFQHRWRARVVEGLQAEQLGRRNRTIAIACFASRPGIVIHRIRFADGLEKEFKAPWLDEGALRSEDMADSGLRIDRECLGRHDQVLW